MTISSLSWSPTCPSTPPRREYLWIRHVYRPMLTLHSLDDLVPKKRLTLTLKLNSNANTVPLFSYFLRMPDQLVSSAHFRPEVMRRIRQTREEEAKKVRKFIEAEGAEDRKLLSDKAKKEQRDRKLKGMSADEQKRFLEREREKEQRKRSGKQTMRA